MCRPLTPIEMPKMEKSEYEMIRLQNIEEIEAAHLEIFGTPVDIRVGRKLTLSSDFLCHFSTALTYRIRKAGTIAHVLIWDLPLGQFPIWW